MTSPTPADPISVLVHGSSIEVEPSDAVQDIAVILTENEIGAVCVHGQQGPIGIASERDVVHAVADGIDTNVERATDVMTFEVVTIDREQPIEVAAKIMVEGAIRHLAALDGDKLIGVVSMRDVLSVYVS